MPRHFCPTHNLWCRQCHRPRSSSHTPSPFRVYAPPSPCPYHQLRSQPNQGTWIFDATSAHHSCSNLLLFDMSTFIYLRNSYTYTTTGERHRIAGVGNVTLFIKVEGLCRRLRLEDVSYIPDQRGEQRFSFYRFSREGFRMATMGRELKLYKNEGMWQILCTGYKNRDSMAFEIDLCRREHIGGIRCDGRH